MGISGSNWDGTVSESEFYVTARALCDKWKVTYPLFPPWTWVVASCSFGGVSRQVQGYLSLDRFPCPRSIEASSSSWQDTGDGISVNGDPASTIKEDPSDVAALVHTSHPDIHFYDLHILYTTSYRVPVLYFRGYHCDGKPLESDDIEKDLPYHSSKIIKDSRWTFITLEEHPYLNRPWYRLHPCGTSEWMKLLLNGDTSVTGGGELIQQYLSSWLSVVGQVVGLQVPLEVFKTYTCPYSTVGAGFGKSS